MRIYTDRRGRVRGYSLGPGGLVLAMFLSAAVLAVLALPFVWPYVVVGGAAGIALTVVWDLLLLVTVLRVRASWRELERRESSPPRP